MPRRPRPAHRQLSQNVSKITSKLNISTKSSFSAGSKRRLIEAEQSESSEESDSGLDLRDGEEFEEGSSQASGSALEDEDEEEEDDVDVDAPRVAQWEEDDEGLLEESEAENDHPEEVRMQIVSFKKNMSEI